MKSQSYAVKFKKFIQYLEGQGGDISDPLLEMRFEKLFCHTGGNEVNHIMTWYDTQREKVTMGVERIPLSECREWSLDHESGSFVHSSGEFYRVDGIRISKSTSREVSGGWDQPILTQVGYDGGILGLLRCRSKGVPYYLVEAKCEPGNYNFIQISTTVQATFSNLKRAHKGAQTPYSNFFLDTKKFDAELIFDRWMSEDGGRLYNKRNRSMIVEIPEDSAVEIIDDRYRWVSLYSLMHLVANHDAVVAPHIRGILAGV